jgi:hypothetical protein
MIPRQTQLQENSFVSLSFLDSEAKHNEWREASPSLVVAQQFSSPARFGTQFPNPQYSPAGSIPFGTTVKENPFAPEANEQADLDSQIEADLQELGGQMAGSILDF